MEHLCTVFIIIVIDTGHNFLCILMQTVVQRNLKAAKKAKICKKNLTQSFKFNGNSLKRNSPRFTTSDVKVTRWSPEARTRAKLRSSYGWLPEARQAVAVVRQAARGLARNGGPTEAGEAARVAQVDG